MKRTVLISLTAIAMVASLGGCRLRVRPPRGQISVRVPQPRVAVQVQVPAPPQLQAGVTIVQAQCSPGAAEVCNGLDDNCNGVIDEGCGYNTGNIQITLAWSTGADLDLYVTDPANFTISYQNRNSPTGGHLDHDARGDCNRRQANPTIENVYWDAVNPPSGQYRAEVHYWGNCNTAGATQATLSIAVGGQIIGAYTLVLNPQDRQPVAFFDIP